MGRRRIVALGLALALLTLAGCGGKATPSQQPSTNQPPASSTQEPDQKKEDLKLTLYAGMFEDHARAAIEVFEAETGIKVEWVRMSSGETLTRIRAEKDNPKASVWWGGPADAYVAAAQEGLLEKYVSPAAALVDDQFKDPEGYWTGVYVGLLGFASNTQILEEMGIEAPQSWADLLKPEFRDQIAMANPGSSGTSYTMLATIIQLMGEEEGLEYMAKLHEQIAQYPKSGTAPGQMAGRGEVIVGITFAHDAVKYAEEGMPLVVTFPSEGTGYEIGGLALIKGGPDQEAAKIFIDWALSKEAQELGQQFGSYQALTNKEATPPPQSFALDSVETIHYDMQWAGEHRTELVEKWSNKVNME